jgi:glycosyltransferase involved in cell wall biosynthesis
MTIHSVALLLDDMGGGGAARVAASLSAAWAEMGRKVTILTGDDGQRPSHYPLHPTVAHQPLALHAPSRGPLAAVRANLGRLARLRRTIRSLSPDLIVSFLDTVNVRCLLATRGLGIPVLVSERTDPHGRSIGLAWEGLRLLTYPWSGGLVVQSQHALAYFPPRIRAKGLVIPNPVLPAPEAVPAPRGDRLAVVTLGSLRSVKGQDQLIEAFALLADQFPRWDLWIHGEGPAREALEAQVQALRLEARVHLPGSTAETTARLREGDLFVLPSRAEGFPNALAEAMACGLPVVSFDCASGPRDLIRNGMDGILVPPGDIPALATAMAQLMADPSERGRLSACAPEVVKRFSVEKVLELWEQALQRALWSR